MIFLEADELLLEEYTSTVNEVVSGQILNMLLALPHLPTVHLVVVLVRSVNSEKGEEEEAEPEAAITHEVKVSVVVHRVVRARTLEINDVRAHPVLEFDGILLINKGSILMIVV